LIPTTARFRVAPRTRWKIVESSSVTDESLEAIVNEFTGAGWTFEGIQFAMRESSKRPAMAFVLFTKALSEQEGAAAEPQSRSEAVPEPAAPVADGSR
jgi:hypothetical protein